MHAARAAHVELAVSHGHAFRLLPHRDAAHGLEALCIENHHGAVVVAAVNPAAHVGQRTVKGDCARRRDVDLTDALERRGLHHLHLVRAVDHGIEPVAVELQVVAHIAQSHDHVGVRLDVEVFIVCARREVELVDACLILAEGAFVENVHTRIAGNSHRLALLVGFGTGRFLGVVAT